MKTPKSLESLIEDGLIDDVIRQLMRGRKLLYTLYAVERMCDVPKFIRKPINAVLGKV